MSDEVVVVYVDEVRGDVVLGSEGLLTQLSLCSCLPSLGDHICSRKRFPHPRSSAKFPNPHLEQMGSRNE